MPAPHLDSPTVSVLLVEDESVTRDALRTMLEVSHMHVTAVQSGPDALRLLTEQSFDVLVTDIMMPDIDGISLLKQIRKDHADSDLPVILITGFSSLNTAIDALKLGAHDYLLKPITDINRFSTCVRQAADHHRLASHARALQQRLKESEATFRAVFQNANDLIFLHRLTAHSELGTCIEVNDMACSCLRHSRPDLLEQAPHNLFPADCWRTVQKRIKRLAVSKTVRLETQMLTAGGRELAVDIIAHRFTLNRRKVVLSVIRDMSERRAMEARLAEASDKERAMLGRELHDVLCQDLTSISMMCAVLKQGPGPHSPTYKDDVDMVHDLSVRVLGFAKQLSTGLLPMQLEEQDLSTALEQLAFSTDHLFNVSCTFTRNGRVVTDDPAVALHLYRIAQEAVNNAIKHSQAAAISIGLKPQSGGGVITIDDNGKGLPRGRRGTDGMGMNIMKHRAKIVGATLNIKKAPSGGTRIMCTWK